MPWNLDSSRPIYLQIIERVQMDIITGAISRAISFRPSAISRRRPPSTRTQCRKRFPNWNAAD